VCEACLRLGLMVKVVLNLGKSDILRLSIKKY